MQLGKKLLGCCKMMMIFENMEQKTYILVPPSSISYSFRPKPFPFSRQHLFNPFFSFPLSPPPATSFPIGLSPPNQPKPRLTYPPAFLSPFGSFSRPRKLGRDSEGRGSWGLIQTKFGILRSSRGAVGRFGMQEGSKARREYERERK